MNSIKTSNQMAKEMCAAESKYRYLYGGKDQDYTSTLVNKLAKQYPSTYTKSLLAEALKDADKGYKAIDCSGFVCKVLGVKGQGSSQLKNGAVKVLPIDKSQAREGMAIWKNGHIGYIGEGLKIYEANSTKADMKVYSFDSRAKAFTYMLVVDGSALAEELNQKVLLTGICPLPTMRRNARGEQVRLLQVALNQLGYVGSNGKSLATDGEFGANTEYALKKFQNDFSLTSDGIYGKNSYNVLKSLY